MNKKQERVSIRKFEEAAMSEFEHSSVLEWNGLSIEVKRNLTMKEMAVFVNTAVRSCFSADDGEYSPEAKDVVVRALIIAFYTNIALPSNFDKLYDCLYRSSIVNAVVENVDREQLNITLEAIEDKIKHLADIRYNEIEKQIESVGALGNKFESLFSGVTGEDIENVINAVSNETIDEEKLMKAYIANKQ